MASKPLPCFLDEVPEYEVRDGRMYITMGDLSLAMPLGVYLAGAARGSRAIAEWENGNRKTGEIIPFKRA